ncbi:hypothetical protein LSTR_LSTR000926 [Laodelphax striatellus]|uniref:RING-type domain-containing protein n=1 Tax=Laodelphax striatellus TaxID=195883 RepID=A0A482X0Q2_LAOST|nr:hypothetical protein LSTR_LSTR000926 [Laodelphax striatellus]
MEPLKKGKRKHDDSENSERDLEKILAVIFECTNCLNLSKTTMYECSGGHLYCDKCLNEYIVYEDYTEEVQCSQCSKSRKFFRNRAAENAIGELSAACKYCEKKLILNNMEMHEKCFCEKNITQCEKQSEGCLWSGPYFELEDHQRTCSFQKLLSTVTDQTEEKTNNKTSTITQCFENPFFDRPTFTAFIFLAFIIISCSVIRHLV